MASRYGPGVLPRGRDYQGLADAFLRGRDRRRQRERQDRFDQMATEQHTANLHRQGYRIGERPATQVYEPDFEGTAFDPARAQIPAALPNAFTNTPELRQDPLLARPRLPVSNETALGAMLASPPARGGQPRLKALPGAFVPESGTFADRPLYEQPAMPFRVGSGRMVERPDMGYEQVGEGLWYSEAHSPEGRQMARAALMADAERLNAQAAAEAEQNRLAEALEGIESLTPQQRAAISAGVPLNVATYQPGLSEEERLRTGHDYRMKEIQAQNAWRSDPSNPDAPSNQMLIAERTRAKAASDALTRILMQDWSGYEDERQAAINDVLFNYGYTSRDELHRHMRTIGMRPGADWMDPVPEQTPNPFLRPNPLAALGDGHGGTSALGAALERAARGGAPQVGPTVEAAAAIPARKTLQQRAAELKAEGRSKDEARAILQQEGYLR